MKKLKKKIFASEVIIQFQPLPVHIGSLFFPFLAHCVMIKNNVVKSRCWKFAEKKLQYTTSLYRTKIVQKIVAISDYWKGEKNMNLSNSKFSKVVLPI